MSLPGFRRNGELFIQVDHIVRFGWLVVLGLTTL